jgi:hypothetical protein
MPTILLATESLQNLRNMFLVAKIWQPRTIRSVAGSSGLCQENLHNQSLMLEALSMKGVYMFMHFDAPFQVTTRKMEARGWAWTGTDLICQETRCLYNFGF